MKEKRGKTPHIVAQNGGHLFIDYNFITDFGQFVTKTAEKVYFHFLSASRKSRSLRRFGDFYGCNFGKNGV
ncbi:MAG: hypothetical protein IKH90_03025 [Ruminococcus sp.]|nr:hypothetical protein [Ruminococcus sp.]